MQKKVRSEKVDLLTFTHKGEKAASSVRVLTVIQFVGLDNLHRIVRYAAALNLQYHEKKS